MSQQTVKVISGHILEEETLVSLAELCMSCRAPAEQVIRLIDYGVISPHEGSTSRQWRFHQSAIIRADKALKLKRDLELNLSGTALVLELLDEIEFLRRQVKQASTPAI